MTRIVDLEVLNRTLRVKSANHGEVTCSDDVMSALLLSLQ